MYRNLVAIDPLAMVLSAEVYEKIAEMRHPHEPTQADIDKIVSALSKQDRMAASKNIDSIVHTMSMMQKSLKTQH